ncbi:hypothetical protein ACQ1P1_11340, partial [Ornithobacterium rhinotracheale]
MGIANRGVKTDNQSQHSRIGILNLRGTAVLIEFAFITNKSDMAKYKANVGKIADFLTELLIKYDRNGLFYKPTNFQLAGQLLVNMSFFYLYFFSLMLV